MSVITCSLGVFGKVAWFIANVLVKSPLVVIAPEDIAPEKVAKLSLDNSRATEFVVELAALVKNCMLPPPV